MSSVDGSGSTLTFSGFSGELTGINFSGMERAVLESTNLSTTAAKTYIAAKLYDAGEVSVEFNVNADQTGALTAYPALGAPQAISFTFVDDAGATITFTGTAICTSMDPMSSSVGENITGSATFKLSGAIS
jgi:hypothetical protein